MIDRPQKITLGEMRATGQRELIIYCSDYHCSHNIKLPAAMVDQWPDDVRLSDLEPHFVCQVCGTRGAIIKIAASNRSDGFVNRSHPARAGDAIEAAN
jgi:hypothetical protein